MKKRLIILCALLLSVLLLPACDDAGGGKTIRMDLEAPVQNLDPQFSADPAAQMIISNVYEGLLVERPDGVMTPGVAQSYTVSEDGKTYLFRLREARWSNEDPVTASDFVFAFHRLFSLDTPSPLAGDYACIENGEKVLAGGAYPYQLGVRAVDDRTLEIQLDYEDPLFLKKLSQPAAMPCNQAFFQESQGRYGLAGNLLVNGPFRVETWNNDQYILLRPNPHYASEQPVVPSGVNLYIGRGDSAEQFLSGKSDLAVLSSAQYRELGRPEGQDIAFEQTIWCLVFHQDDPVWGNALLRQGLFHAIDYGQLQEALPQGMRASNQLIPPAAMVGNLNYRQLAGEVSPVPFNKERASYLFELGLKGMDLRNLPLVSLYVPDTGGHSLYIGTVQRGWQENLFAQISLEQVPLEELVNLGRSGSFGMMLAPFSSAQMDVQGLLGVFSCQNGQNELGYCSDLYDRLLSDALARGTLEDLIDGMALAEWQLLFDAAVIPLYVETTYYAAGQGVTGLQVFPDSGKVYFKYANRE